MSEQHRRHAGEGRDAAEGLGRPERPAQGGQAARRGRGRLRRRHQAARDGLHLLRPLAVRARAHHVDRRLEGRGDQGRLRNAHRRGGRGAHRSVLPAVDAAGRAPEGLRARRRQGALRRRGGRRGRRRDARARARRVGARRGRVRAARRRHGRAPRAGRRRAGPPRRLRLEPDVGGRLRVGRPRRRVRRGGQGRQDLGAALPPLQLDAARDRRRARRVQPRHGAVDDLHEQPVPRIRRDHDGAGDAHGPRQAALRHAGHRRRLRQQDHLAPAARRRAACSRGSSTVRCSGRSGAPTSTCRCRTGTSAGSTTPRSRSRPTGRCSASGRRRSTTRARGCATSRSAA